MKELGKGLRLCFTYAFLFSFVFCFSDDDLYTSFLCTGGRTRYDAPLTFGWRPLARDLMCCLDLYIPPCMGEQDFV